MKLQRHWWITVLLIRIEIQVPGILYSVAVAWFLRYPLWFGVLSYLSPRYDFHSTVLDRVCQGMACRF